MDLADRVRLAERARGAEALQQELKGYIEEKQQAPANEQQQNRSPAERLMPEHADRMAEARNRPAAPEPAPEPIKDAEHVATQMEYKPTGQQPAPSVNGPGMSWTNPRANWKPQGQDQPEQSQASQQQSGRSEDLADKVNRELKEASARGEAIDRGIQRIKDLSREEAERRQR